MCGRRLGIGSVETPGLGCDRLLGDCDVTIPGCECDGESVSGLDGLSGLECCGPTLVWARMPELRGRTCVLEFMGDVIPGF